MHMTSLPLDEQLVLELEGWIAVEEAIDIFLGGRCSWFAFLVHENLANTPNEACVGSTFWFRHRIIMVGRWKHWWCNWRAADKLLQEPADRTFFVPKENGESRKVPQDGAE